MLRFLSFMRLILLYIILQLIAQAEAVCNKDGLKGTALCINDVETRCIFTKRNTNFTFSPVEGGEETASYNLKFSAFENKCDFTHYKVAIDYLMGVTNEAACLHDTTDVDEPGTNLIILPHIEVPPVCHKMELSFCYDYWFSGCYRLKFLPSVGANTHKPVDYYVWMKNSYSPAHYVVQTPIFVAQQKQLLIVKWKFNNAFPEGFTSVQHYVKNADTEEIIEEEDCNLNETSLKCSYRRLPTGNYKAVLQIDVPRCKFPGSNCRWEMPFRRESRSSNTEFWSFFTKMFAHS